MATTRLLDGREGVAQPGFGSVGDLYKRLPMHDIDTLQNFFRTIRAVQNHATDNQNLSRNDLIWAWRNLFNRTAVRPGSSVPSNVLTVCDFTRVLASVTGTGETVDGQYVTASAAAGTLLPVGNGVRPSANPTVNHFATAAAHVDNVAVVSLWAYAPNDTGGLFGSLVRGTAATDHLRAVVNLADDTFEIHSRVSSSDTEDGEVSLTGNEAIDGTALRYASVGISVDENDDVRGYLNGALMVTDASPTGAALSGNAVGVHFSGTSAVMTPVLVAMVALAIP